ncbi:MAG: hypothetical protein OEY85_10225, partial [Rhodospirillales bacterium]|nr:hypothetical protein [Rhodospirillales bacterium]
MAEPGGTDQPTKRRVNRIVAGIALALAAAVVASFLFASKFVEDEYQRDVQAWQIRLNIVADSRAASVNSWIDGNFTNMLELAENASLQLYLTELVLAEGSAANAGERLAEAEYLRTLLIDTANRSGFSAPTGEEVAANVERVGIAGIGLVDQSGKGIISTPGMPPISPEIRKAVAKALGGEPALVDIYLGAGNQPTMGFVLPIFAVQGEQTGGIGAVVGIRTVGKDLYNLLKQPGDTSQTSETYLVRPSGPSVEYISPLANGTPPLKLKLSRDDDSLSAAFALKNPGNFGTKKDYDSTEVLTVSRPLAIAPWVLVRKISTTEALAETEERVQTLFTVLVLIIISVSVALIAVWRHGTSLRAAEAAENYRLSSNRFENLSRFMRIVTDSQPTQIAAVDKQGHYTFANRHAANEAGISPEDIKGKSMASVIGPVKAKVFAQLNQESLA